MTFEVMSNGDNVLVCQKCGRIVYARQESIND